MAIHSEKEPMQNVTAPTKPRILLAASGSVAAIKFGSLCHSFCEWAEVRAVVTKSSMHFIDIASLPRDLILYTDEDEWSSWKKIGDGVLHIELRKWADVMVIAPLSANTLAKVVLAAQLFCWTGQFIGHGVFEKRAPALLDNLTQAFVMAPFFVLLEALQMICGYEPYPGFHAKVQAKIDAQIKEYHEKRQKKVS